MHFLWLCMYSDCCDNVSSGVLSPLEDSEGRRWFFRQEMQREDDEGSHWNPLVFLLWTWVWITNTTQSQKYVMWAGSQWDYSLCLSVSLQGFIVKSYQSLPELTAAFQEINMTEIYQQIQPSLSDWQHTGYHGDWTFKLRHPWQDPDWSKEELAAQNSKKWNLPIPNSDGDLKKKGSVQH